MQFIVKPFIHTVLRMITLHDLCVDITQQHTHQTLQVCNDIVVFFFLWLLGGVCGVVFPLHCGIELVRVHGGNCGAIRLIGFH